MMSTREQEIMSTKEKRKMFTNVQSMVSTKEQRKDVYQGAVKDIFQAAEVHRCHQGSEMMAYPVRKLGCPQAEKDLQVRSRGGFLPSTVLEEEAYQN